MGPYSGAIVDVGKAGATVTETVRAFTGLASDSREVKPGFLFAAISGTKTDGARFIDDAVSRGAVAVLGPATAKARARALKVRFIEDANPRRRLALMAAEFFRAQPSMVAAITGTNGKTSVTVFLRQIWAQLGRNAASMGTIGVIAPSLSVHLKHTTPDPVELHEILARLKEKDVDYLALEASSHGLDQFRLDGVDIAAGAFTNITRDHLDYHRDFESYLKAKARLFTELVRKGGSAVINADGEHAAEFREAARKGELKVFGTGTAGDELKLVSATPEKGGQALAVSHAGAVYNLKLPLAGRFQASNALVAAGLAIVLGEKPAAVLEALESLKGAPGRLELVAHAASGAPIFVDYAHTPDALETILKALRPHTSGKLHVVFGCGGDRDTGKRPLMGTVAAEFADNVIVTDDNPRSEPAQAIREAILARSPGAREIGDRRQAIREGIASLAQGDLLVIAGKGHETGQTVGVEVLPFSDRNEAIEAARATGGEAEPSQ